MACGWSICGGGGLARVTVQRAPTVFGHHVDTGTDGEETKGTRFPGLRGGASPVLVSSSLIEACLGPEFPASSTIVGDRPRGDDGDRHILAGCGGHFNIWTTDLPESRVLFGIKFRLFSTSV